MLLIQQSNWVDIPYVTSMGIAVRAVAPGLEDRVLQVGSALVLKIDGGRILRLLDLPDLITETGPVIHRFIAWLPGPRFYLVNIPGIHVFTTLLIDARDGKVADIELPPLMSPNGEIGLIWMLNFLDGNVGPTLIDFRHHPPGQHFVGEPNCEKRDKPYLLRPTAVWQNDQTVIFEGTSGMPDQDRNAKQVLRVVDGKGQWQC